ncbi:hypothetical protein [Virgibacillus sp. CBA3643]|uniref:hypothetical protein n=1 Tax=Virgibacillus sp. CBA3643 TaxID=2942278 RepID=UPI0035A286CF
MIVIVYMEGINRTAEESTRERKNRPDNQEINPRAGRIDRRAEESTACIINFFHLIFNTYGKNPT